MPHLLFVDERGRKRSCEIAGKLSIGRLEGNDLLLRDDLVSRHHCVIEKDGDGFRLTDLSSRFGSFVTWV